MPPKSNKRSAADAGLGDLAEEGPAKKKPRTRLTWRELLKRMGYLRRVRPSYSCPERKEIDIAVRGSHRRDVDTRAAFDWSVERKMVSGEIRLAFRDALDKRERKCIRCDEDSVNCEKPFCDACFKEVAAQTRHYYDFKRWEEGRVAVSKEARNEMVDKYAWLNLLDSCEWKQGMPCQLCNKTLQGRNDFVFYFGSKLAVCDRCLKTGEAKLLARTDTAAATAPKNRDTGHQGENKDHGKAS